ncbi:MAG: fatty acid desaturase [Planctomycetia bacterium]
MSTLAPSRPVHAQGVHWEYLVPIAAVHLLACLAVMPWCFSWSGVVLAAIGTNFFGTLGINLCYHRLLSHRSFTVPRWLERGLTTIALCSLEDTPSRWVANHRLHHQHSDEEQDPHSPRDGVVWSHMAGSSNGCRSGGRGRFSSGTPATSSLTATTATWSETPGASS